MIVDLITKKEISSYGGSKDYYIVNSVLKETPPDEASYVSLVENKKTYFIDYKTFSNLEGYRRTYPYQSLLPSSCSPKDCFIIDKTGSLPIVSVVKDGVVLVSHIFERDITKEELSRQAVIHELTTYETKEITSYTPHKATLFVDKNIFYKEKVAKKKETIVLILLIVIASVFLFRYAMFVLEKMKIKKEMEQVASIKGSIIKSIPTHPVVDIRILSKEKALNKKLEEVLVKIGNLKVKELKGNTLIIEDPNQSAYILLREYKPKIVENDIVIIIGEEIDSSKKNRTDNKSK